MEKLLKRRCFFNIITLIFLTGFLVLPNICLGIDIENITSKEIDKYLAIPEKEVDVLIHSLINLFHSEWLKLMVSPSSTVEETAVSIIMREVVRAQVLNHLLVDAPVKTIFNIIQNATKAARIFLTQDYAAILKELEKESAKKAVNYGISVLFENEIRISPGVIEFKYIAKDNKEKIALFQYLIIYQPTASNKGEILIRFYSLNPLEPPQDKIRSYGIGMYTELIHDLPPFIVDVRGSVKDFKWVGQPAIEIDFPPEVPDLGIRPLSFWERLVLKPFESMIKDVEVIITKVTGKSLGLVDAWKAIKSFVSGIANLSPAAIFFPSEEKSAEQATIVKESAVVEEKVITATAPTPAVSPTPTPLPAAPPPTPSLEELQKILDDIARQINFLTQRFAELAKQKEGAEEEILNQTCININTASAAELTKIIYIGVSRAQQIIQLRQERLFSSVEDLVRVSGIGEKTLAAILNQGLACVGPEAPPPIKTTETTKTPTSTSTSTPTQKEEDVCSINSININTAPKEELQKITGVGPVIAQRIIDGRPFSSVYDLIRVSGIGAITLQKIINQGCAYVEEENDASDSEEAQEEQEEGEEGETATEEPEEVFIPRVVINEIAWMGTKADWNDEWIEFYNPSPKPIEITGWQLLFYPTGSTEPRINKFSVIDAATPTIDGLSYFLLERTDDNTISDIKADYIFKGALNDNGGILELRDEQGNLVDRVDCPGGKWFAGDKEKRISMERIDSTKSGSDPQNWANNNLVARNGLDAAGNNINGTPKAENSVSKKETQLSYLPFYEGFNEITLSFYGSPYIVSHFNVPQNKTLIIEPGVVMKFRDVYTGITIEGTIKAIGTDDKKIVFTSYRDEEYGGSGGAVAGDWRQIFFGPTSAGSELNNVIVRYGGAYPSIFPCDWHTAAVFVEQSSITLKNSIIENNRMKGVYLIDSSSTVDNVFFRDNQVGCWSDDKTATALLISGGKPLVKNSFFKNNINGIEIWSDATPEIKNNTFEENETPIFVMSASPIFGTNEAKNNALNGIIVRGDITKNAIWSSSLPYIITLDLNISQGATLTFEAGTVIKFRSPNDIMTIKGTLMAIGTIDKKIIFTSYEDENYGGTGNSSWKALYFYSSGSILENVIVRYGGGSYGCYGCPKQNYGAITLDSENIEITVKDSILEKNKYAVAIFNNDNCSLVGRVVAKMMLENTIFRENESNTHPPECSL